MASVISVVSVAVYVWLLLRFAAGAPASPLNGRVNITIGIIIAPCDAVVNVHVRFCLSGLPARFFTPVVRVAVYVSPGSGGDAGMNSACLMQYMHACRCEAMTGLAWLAG